MNNMRRKETFEIASDFRGVCREMVESGTHKTYIDKCKLHKLVTQRHVEHVKWLRVISVVGKRKRRKKMVSIEKNGNRTFEHLNCERSFLKQLNRNDRSKYLCYLCYK